jgi:hypothetical protein
MHNLSVLKMSPFHSQPNSLLLGLLQKSLTMFWM